MKETSDVPVPKEATATETPPEPVGQDNKEELEERADKPAQSDADWARSRTSRLLGLLDEDEEENAAPTNRPEPSDDGSDGRGFGAR